MSSIELFGTTYELPEKVKHSNVNQPVEHITKYTLTCNTLIEELLIKVRETKNGQGYGLTVGHQTYEGREEAIQKAFENILPIFEKEYILTKSEGSEIIGWDSSGIVLWDGTDIQNVPTEEFLTLFPSTWPTVPEFKFNQTPNSFQGCIKLEFRSIPWIIKGYMYIYENCILIIDTFVTIELFIVPIPNIEFVARSASKCLEKGSEVVSATGEFRNYLLTQEI